MGLGKRIAADAGWWSLKALAMMASNTHPRTIHDFSVPLAHLLLRISRKRRSIAERYIDIAFGDSLDPWRKHAILVNSTINGVCELGEVVYYAHHMPQLARNIEFDGLERLKNAHSRGSGVVLLTAHVGNFSLIIGLLNLLGYPTAPITRDPHDVRVTRLKHKLLAMADIPYVLDRPAARSARRSIRWVRSGGILAVQIDQKPGSKQGVIVDFFGRPTPTFSGPAAIAVKTGAPVVPAFIERVHKHRHVIHVLPEIPIRRTGDRQENILAALQEMSRVTEQAMRDYPDSTWWITRRWRD